MSDKTDALFERLTDIAENVVELVQQQNQITQEQSRLLMLAPTKKYVNMVLIAVVILLASFQAASYVSIKNVLHQNAAIGKQNDALVVAYCLAQPTLPECVNSGSATAKATTMQTNCRVFETLRSMTGFTSTNLSTDHACKAIGF